MVTTGFSGVPFVERSDLLKVGLKAPSMFADAANSVASSAIGSAIGAAIDEADFPGISISAPGPSSGIGGLSSSGLSGFASSLKFPSNLTSDKFIKIGVYDTSENDKIQDAMVGATEAVTNRMQDAFKAVGDAKSVGDLAQKAYDGAKKLGDDIVKGLDWVKNNWTSIANNALKQGQKFFSQIGQNGFGNAKLARTWKANIYLPIPNDLSEQLSHMYEAQDGWFASLVPDKAKAIGDKINQASANIAKATGGRQIKFYENKIQMYQSTGFREISLAWDLIPNNQSEAMSLYNIIRAFKKFSSPEAKAGKLLIKAPNFFSLEFNNRVLDPALQFHEVVCTNISANYVPGGTMEMFRDDVPKHAQLSLQFRDREPKLAEDWDAQPSHSGNSKGAACQGTPSVNASSQSPGGTKNKSTSSNTNPASATSSKNDDVYDNYFGTPGEEYKYSDDTWMGV